MGTAIADILPQAVGVAISCLGIVAVILTLFSKNARSASLGYLIGWVLGIVIFLTIMVVVAQPTEEATGGEASPLSGIVHLLLALLFFYLAYKNWKQRPKPGEQGEMPKWMSSIDAMTAGKALVLGVLLGAINPKNAALIISAGVSIVAAGLETTQTIIVMIVFIIIACVSIAAPVIVYLTMGDKATPMLNSWKSWLTFNNATVMMILFLLFGVSMLSKGISGLTGG
jgi:threonine/homoserine/homoserine lactone efflux protein